MPVARLLLINLEALSGAREAARSRPCLLGDCGLHSLSSLRCALKDTLFLCLRPFTFLLSKLVLGRAPAAFVGPEMQLSMGATFWVPPHPEVSSKH